MDIKKLQAIVIDALENVKAQDIVLFDTTQQTSLFDRIAVASGTSNRQTKALASSVRDKVKEAGGTIVGIEGEDTGEWVLVDLGDMIVHIMQPAIRAYYRLEEIWGGKEIKLGAAKRTSKRTATATAPEDATQKPAVRKRVTRSAAPQEKEAAPKKTRATSAASEKKPAARTRKPSVANAAATAETTVAEKPKTTKRRISAKKPAVE
jgi:ribosome-associated protein